FSRIHATATEVSRPPENAMPTFSPTGRDWSTLDMVSILSACGVSLFSPQEAHGQCPRLRLTQTMAEPTAMIPTAIPAMYKATVTYPLSKLWGSRNGYGYQYGA